MYIINDYDKINKILITLIQIQNILNLSHEIEPRIIFSFVELLEVPKTANHVCFLPYNLLYYYYIDKK